MKSACCKNEIVIQTDPKNCEYVIISGAQKKTEDYDIEDAETLLLPPDEGACCYNDILIIGNLMKIEGGDYFHGTCSGVCFAFMVGKNGDTLMPVI